MKPLLPTLIWTAALGALFFLDPAQDGPSLCLFKALGSSWCPGCGLGHAVHYALHGQWTASLEAHWLGLPATGALIVQALQPLIRHFQKRLL
ncbi:MAG: DUF2752 domain-containing protein [Chitinophagaceae bacterium]|nr:MAG: DUF2752 domain-containing protein [Chitinophagaceae bacterium]